LPDHPQFRISAELPEVFSRPVGTSVIDNDNFIRGKILMQERINGLFQ
jgi:hypothetical protein